MGWAAIGIKLIPIILGAIRSTETNSTKKGDGKLGDALTTVDAFMASLEGSCNQTLTQVDAVRDAIKEVMQAMVKLQNAVAASKQS